MSDAQNSLWRVSLQDKAQTAALDRDLAADLVIIGGGFTGCSAALEAARRGAKVVLLEARDIGYGGSGRNAGLVNAGLWLPPDTIVAQMGQTDGRRLIDALGRAPDRVFDIIEREGIACEATRSGTLNLAHSPVGLRELEDRHRQGNATGAALQLLDAAETQDRTGSGAFFGALLNPRAGTVQPLAYCHGLARAAQNAGARLFSGTTAVSIIRDGNGWQVTTGAGVVRAQALLLAANAYGTGAAGGGRSQFVPTHYSQFATDPLPQAAQDTILPGLEGCWDTALAMSSVRKDAAGRLIIGCMGHSDGAGGRVHTGWARRKLRALFPQLGDIPFQHDWSGRIAMTRDHVPKVERIGTLGYSIFGYSGRGIAPGTVFGAAAARALLEDDPAAFPVPVTESYSERFTGLRQAYFEFGVTLIHAVGDRFGP